MKFANSLRTAVFTVILLVGVVGSPGQSRALELGLTPSNVVGLWTNVNNALLATARVVSNDQSWWNKLETMSPNSFEGKKPGDVLKRVTEFRASLNKLRQGFGLKEADSNVRFDGTVTPSVVFLNTGEVLNGLVDWLIRNTSEQQLVSQFYADHKITGKTPSDAFSMVDLAVRRLEEIITKAGA